MWHAQVLRRLNDAEEKKGLERCNELATSTMKSNHPCTEIYFMTHSTQMHPQTMSPVDNRHLLTPSCHVTDTIS